MSRVIASAAVPGAFRAPNGSDTIIFFGSNEVEDFRRPKLWLRLKALTVPLGSPSPLPPVPSPLVPRGRPGTITNGNETSVEITCDGGPGGVFDVRCRAARLRAPCSVPLCPCAVLRVMCSVLWALCCCAAVLLCCCAAVLLCCCAAVLLCCCAAVLRALSICTPLSHTSIVEHWHVAGLRCGSARVCDGVR